MKKFFKISCKEFRLPGTSLITDLLIMRYINVHFTYLLTYICHILVFSAVTLLVEGHKGCTAFKKSPNIHNIHF